MESPQHKMGQTYTNTAIPSECLWFWFYFPVAIAYRYRLRWCSSHEVINLSCYHSWLGVSGLQRKLSLVEIAFVSTFLARKEDRPSSSLLGLSLEFVPSKVSSGGNGTQVSATKTFASSGRMINVLTGWYPESSWQPNKDQLRSICTGYAREPVGKWSKAEGMMISACQWPQHSRLLKNQPNAMHNKSWDALFQGKWHLCLCRHSQEGMAMYGPLWHI